ncbi:MAG: hypothetical protein ACTHMA_18150 [Thermomicrobiales bacterium]
MMTRQIVRLDTSSNPSQSINLPFSAEILSVINPTASSIGISLGGNIPPTSVQNSDIWIPADSGINYPIAGSNFAAAFIPPLLVNAPTGIPTAANLLFTAGEPVPNFGAFPLSTLATQSLQDVSLIAATDTRAVTVFSRSVPITPDIQSLTVSFVSGGFAPDSTGETEIKGDQSGIVYWHMPSNANSQVLYNFNAPFFGGADTSVTLSVYYLATQGNARTVSLWGHRYSIGPSLAPSGSVSVAPSPSVTPWPVSISGGANPSWLHAPTYAAYQLVQNPTVSQIIAVISNIPAGTYRIEWEISCDSPTAVVSKKAYVVNSVAPAQLAAVPFPGGRSGVISAYFSSAVFALGIQNGIAITDGSYLLGGLRVWAL